MSTSEPIRVSGLILAAGQNVRLQSVLPAGFKPLMLVNGKTLVRHAYDHLSLDWSAEDTVVVVNPTNAGPIAQILDHGNDDRHLHMAVQYRPTDVVDAIRIGTRMLPDSEVTVIVCADNMFELLPGFDTMSVVDRSCEQPSVATRRIQKPESERFTRIVCGAPISANIKLDDPYEEDELCWVGPLVVPTFKLKAAVETRDQMNVTNLLRRIALQWNAFPMLCSDLGVMEELP